MILLGSSIMRVTGSRARGCRAVPGRTQGWGPCQLHCLWNILSTFICGAQLVLTFEKLLLCPDLTVGKKTCGNDIWLGKKASKPQKERKIMRLCLIYSLGPSVRSVQGRVLHFCEGAIPLSPGNAHGSKTVYCFCY